MKKHRQIGVVYGNVHWDKVMIKIAPAISKELLLLLVSRRDHKLSFIVGAQLKDNLTLNIRYKKA